MKKVLQMIASIRKHFSNVSALLNNLGMTPINYSLITQMESFQHIFRTNIFEYFLSLREVFKLMIAQKMGRIGKFTSVANPSNLVGELGYVSKKVTVEFLKNIITRTVDCYSITINGISTTHLPSDLIKTVPKSKINSPLSSKAIKQLVTFEDIKNVALCFIYPKTHFIIS